MSWFKRKTKVPKNAAVIEIAAPRHTAATYEPSDFARRVLANLSVPIRTQDLASLLIEDEHCYGTEPADVEAKAKEVLDQYEADGLVVCLRNIGTPDELVADADAVVQIHPDKAFAIRSLWGTKYKDTLVAREPRYYWTPAGYEVLNGVKP